MKDLAGEDDEEAQMDSKVERSLKRAQSRPTRAHRKTTRLVALTEEANAEEADAANESPPASPRSASQASEQAEVKPTRPIRFFISGLTSTTEYNFSLEVSYGLIASDPVRVQLGKLNALDGDIPLPAVVSMPVEKQDPRARVITLRVPPDPLFLTEYRPAKKAWYGTEEPWTPFERQTSTEVALPDLLPARGLTLIKLPKATSDAVDVLEVRASARPKLN